MPFSFGYVPPTAPAAPSARPLDFTTWHYQNPQAGVGNTLQSDTSPYSLYQQYLAGFRGGGGGGAPGTSGLPGATPLPGTYNPAFGGIPGTTSPSVSQGNLLAGISSNLPALAGASGGLSQVGQNNLLGQYGTTIPNLPGLFSGAAGNVASEIAGDVSSLTPQMNQQEAEWAVQHGLPPGSQYGESKRLRDLGLNEIALRNMGQTNLLNLTRGAPVAGPADLNRLTPDINLQTTLQQLADTLRSAPIPAALQEALMRLAQQGLSRGAGGVSYGGGAGPSVGGGGGSPVEDILRRYGSGLGITPSPTSTASAGGGSYDTYGAGQDDYSDVLAALDEAQPRDLSDVNAIYQDFGLPLPTLPEGYGQYGQPNFIDPEQYNQMLYQAAGYNPSYYE